MKPDITKYFVILIVLLFAGCASFGDKHRIELLAETTEKYEDAIRWGLYDIAENIRMADDDVKQATDFENLKKIKVTAYKSVNKSLSEDGTEARQTIEIKYYHTDYMIEKILIDKQVWKYDPKNKAWRLQSGLPAFK